MGVNEKHFYAILCILPFPFIHTNNKNKQDDVKENRRGFPTSESKKDLAFYWIAAFRQSLSA